MRLAPWVPKCDIVPWCRQRSSRVRILGGVDLSETIESYDDPFTLTADVRPGARALAIGLRLCMCARRHK
eukprot:1772639-Prymnesium_polylepis.1